jgi:hypothetical protein
LKEAKIIKPPFFCQDFFGSYHQKDIAVKRTRQRWLFRLLEFEGLIPR